MTTAKRFVSHTTIYYDTPIALALLKTADDFARAHGIFGLVKVGEYVTLAVEAIVRNGVSGVSGMVPDAEHDDRVRRLWDLTKRAVIGNMECDLCSPHDDGRINALTGDFKTKNRPMVLVGRWE